jgi:AcrR family transcriptional regulator
VSGPPTRAGGTAARRRARREEIVQATRDLFDARGVREANIDDIARAVGVNRAIIYRHFTSKDELFALTLAGYLRELDAQLDAADDPAAASTGRLAALADVFAGYALAHPAFLDSALWLLRQPRQELVDGISEGSLLALGQLMATSLGRLAAVLRAGDAAGELAVEDPDLHAMALYAQGLGVLQLARSGCYLRGGDGPPQVVPVGEDVVRRLVVDALVGAALRPGRG